MNRTVTMREMTETTVKVGPRLVRELPPGTVRVALEGHLLRRHPENPGKNAAGPQ
jgi:hypothetical protein